MVFSNAQENKQLISVDLVNFLGALGFPGGTVVKNLPAMQETQPRFLGQKDPLKKCLTTHSSIFPWEIPWTEECNGVQSMGLQESDMA